MAEREPRKGSGIFGSAEGFSNVDSSAAPERFAEYLDRVTRVLIGRKRETLALLELRAGDALLDFGCGLGVDVFETESIVGPSGRDVGVDTSAAMLGEARTRAAEAHSSAEFHLSRADSLGFADATFDAARTERVVMHVGDPARFVADLVRVLKPGGRLVCREPDHQMSALDASDGALSDRVMRGLSSAIASSRIGRQLRGIFIAAGLENVRMEVLSRVMTSLANYRGMHWARPTR